MADEQSHYEKYDKRTNKKMAEHNRSGGDVRKPVRTVEGASSKDRRDRARFAFRKASQALTASHPLKDDQGRPTPAAMQFKRWGFKVPQNREDLQRLKAFGEKHMKKPEDMEKAMSGQLELFGNKSASHTLPSGAVVTHRYYNEGHGDNPKGHSYTLDVTNPEGNARTQLELRHNPEHNQPGEYDALASVRKMEGVPVGSSNRGKFGGQVMKELRTHLGEHLPQVKQVVWRNSNDKLREMSMKKSWIDAGDNKPTSQWTVKPFSTMRPERGVEHARISAPGNRGAVMSFKHNKKTGHTEILNFRAYTYHDDAFKAGSEAMARGVPMADVDNIMEFHRSNVGVIGPAGVRAAARYLKEKIGSKTVGGLRVSGTRMNNENDLERAPTRRQGNLESLPGVKVKRELTKAIDYEALDEEYDPKPKKAGKGGKGSPVGSRADQQRHQTPAFNATHKRIAELKPEGVSNAEWKSGVKHESEHENVAPSKVDQAKIAAVHLKEEPHYYAKLKRAGIK